MNNIKKILKILTHQERKRTYQLLIMIIIMAFLDMVGVASIMPFIVVLTNYNTLEKIPLFNDLYFFFNFKNKNEFIISLGMVVFFIILFSLFFKAFTIYVQNRLTLMREYSITRRLIEGYLHQPYEWFLNRNSSELAKNILSEVSAVVNQGIIPFTNFISSLAVTLALIFLIVYFTPSLALVLGAALGFFYWIIFYFLNNFLKRIGKESYKNNEKRFMIVRESFSDFKLVKARGIEQFFLNQFSEPAKKYATLQSIALIVAQLPRFAIEIVAFAGLFLITVYMVFKTSSFNEVAHIITLYAFVGFRLMPALHMMYSSLSLLRFVGPSIDILEKDFMFIEKTSQSSAIIDHQDKLLFNETIKLKNIVYNYPNTTTPALKNITFTIPIKNTLGVVGFTGSGKTTLVDIVHGLLEAQQGTLEVDGQVITKHNLRAWQRNIGYVPQQVYLIDDSVTANIAFGIKHEDIDYQAVERAAKIANLHNFIMNDLPNQYQTIVGEAGIRLSGGERQRIGIARALYYNPQLLILDEATSALDNITEKAFMESLEGLKHKITIIIIAHRLSTIKYCDQIIVLEKGEVKGEDIYEKLSTTNNIFKKMIDVIK
jgi:ABC-type branched-subunit amino acid transport system ATPase component